MDARKLKVGIKVKYSSGTIVKVTSVPKLDRHGECFFSGIVIESKQSHLKDYIGKNVNDNWNSAFCFPV